MLHVAPENFNKDDSIQQSSFEGDIYSLGIVAYEILSRSFIQDAATNHMVEIFIKFLLAVVILIVYRGYFYKLAFITLLQKFRPFFHRSYTRCSLTTSEICLWIMLLSLTTVFWLSTTKSAVSSSHHQGGYNATKVAR